MSTKPLPPLHLSPDAEPVDATMVAERVLALTGIDVTKALARGNITVGLAKHHYPNTAGPFVGRIAGQAFTEFELAAAHTGAALTIFCRTDAGRPWQMVGALDRIYGHGSIVEVAHLAAVMSHLHATGRLAVPA